MTKFYAVRKGRTPGIYTSWLECEEQVKDFKGAAHKSFAKLKDAEAFMRGESAATKTIVKSKDNDPLAFLKKLPEDCVVVYCDGACRNNQDPKTRKAGVGVWFGEDDDRNVSEPLRGDNQTNNRAELTSALRALQKAPRNRPLCVCMDSSYSLDIMLDYVKKWKTQNWFRFGEWDHPDAKKNCDIVSEILFEQDQRTAPTLWQYVPGHDGVHGNEEADALARAGVDMHEVLDEM